MKITILYDNTKFINQLESDWGFAALIEAENHNILFDAGGNGRILLGNMEKLSIDPYIIDTIFISHHHFDHIGGLSEFLNVNNEVTLFSPESFRGVKNVRKNIYIDKSQQLYENIYTTGQLENIEQSLIIKSEKGLVIIVGCSHPGLDSIVEAAEKFGEVFAIIGGFHGYRKFKTLDRVKYFYPAHCTKYSQKIKDIFPDKFMETGVGRVIEI